MKFTANLSLLFTETDLINRFKAAKDNGFDAVEIQFPYALRAETIAEQLHQQQLKLVLFNVDADDLLQGGEGLACVPEKIEQFQWAVQQTVEYAQILAPDVINILPGRCFQTEKTSLYLDTFKKNLHYALSQFAPLDIKTVFEAINSYDMPGFIINNGRQMLDVINHVNHPDLYMQYDIYHMVRMGEDCLHFIPTHAEKIGHIQFADVPGRGQPGSGTINFEQLFSVIENSNYQGYLGAEYTPTDNSHKSLTWLKQYKTPR